MQTILERYIEVSVPDERAQQMIIADALIDRAGYLSHTADLEVIVATGDEHPRESNIGRVDQILTQYLEEIASEFGITVEGTTGLTELIPLVEGLLVIETYGDPQAIINIFDEEQDPIDYVCDVLRLMTQKPIGFFELTIERVNDNLATRIYEIAEGALSDEGPVRDLSPIRQRFAPMRQSFDDLIAIRALQQGHALGSPIDTLLDAFSVDLNTLTQPLQRLPIELLALMLISDLSTSDIPKHAYEIIEQFVEQPVQRERVHGRLRSLFNTYILETS